MVSEEQVENAIKHYDSNLEIENVRDISGRNRQTYEVELSTREVLICCFNKDSPEWFRREEKLIELVNQKTDIPTQNILYSDYSEKKVPEMFHISEKIEGKKSEEAYADLVIGDKEEIVRQIGRYLAETHKNINFQNFGKIRIKENHLEIEECSWKDLIQEISEEYIEGMEGTRFEDLQDEFRGYVEKNLDFIEESNPVLVHYDVAVDNIVRKGTDVKAILDWERAFVGQPEWDLAYSEVRFILQFMEDEKKIQRLKKAFYESYQQVNQLNEGWRTRKEYYGMIQLFHGMKYFDNWTDRKNLSEKEKLDEEKWHRDYFNQNNRKLSY